MVETLPSSLKKQNNTLKRRLKKKKNIRTKFVLLFPDLIETPINQTKMMNEEHTKDHQDLRMTEEGEVASDLEVRIGTPADTMMIDDIENAVTEMTGATAMNVTLGGITGIAMIGEMVGMIDEIAGGMIGGMIEDTAEEKKDTEMVPIVHDASDMTILIGLTIEEICRAVLNDLG